MVVGVFVQTHTKLRQETIPFSTAWWLYHTTTCHLEDKDIDILLPQSQTMDQTSEWRHDVLFSEATLLSDQ